MSGGIPPPPQGGSSKKWKIAIAVVICVIVVVAILVGISLLGILPFSNNTPSTGYTQVYGGTFYSVSGTTSSFKINSNVWEVDWYSSVSSGSGGWQDANSTLSVVIHDASSDAVVQTASIDLNQSSFPPRAFFNVKGTFYMTFSLSGQHWEAANSSVEISVWETPLARD
jgi:hypothetical protein